MHPLQGPVQGGDIKTYPDDLRGGLDRGTQPVGATRQTPERERPLLKQRAEPRTDVTASLLSARSGSGVVCWERHPGLASAGTRLADLSEPSGLRGNRCAGLLQQ